ncbi:hypothetical protein Q7P37_004795 [Cladosporium fusiforme]
MTGNMASLQDKVIITNERVTGSPGVEMIRVSGLAHESNAEILDLACGGGIITNEIIKTASEHSNLNLNRIIAGDIDPRMLDFVANRRDAAIKADTNSHWSRVETQRIDQASLPSPDGTFTHVFSNFGIFFSPAEDSVLSETYRVLKTSGKAGFTSWKSIAWWPTIADPALAQFLPEAPKLPSPDGFFSATGWNDVNAIPAKLEKAGFQDVQVSEFKFRLEIEAEPFANATALLVQSIAKRVWSEEEFGKFGGRVEGALLKFINEHYESGIVDGSMTAIITLGTKR